LDGDSELSELASSVFNGMEGVEMSSGTIIGQDMGGREPSGDDEVSGGESEVTGPVVSPRRTRSSRVRK